MRYVFVTVVLGILSIIPSLIDVFQVMILLWIAMISWDMGLALKSAMMMKVRWRLR